MDHSAPRLSERSPRGHCGIEERECQSRIVLRHPLRVLLSASASAFTRVFDVLWAVHRRARTQNRENNPMQSRLGSGSQHSCCVASGAREEKWSVVTAQPNLIPLQFELLTGDQRSGYFPLVSTFCFSSSFIFL